MALIEATVASFEEEANSLRNRVVITISATLSLLSTTLICITYIAWKDYQSNSRKILVYISVADFLLAASCLFGMWRPHHDRGDIICKIQACVTGCGYLWSLLWTTFLAVYMFTTVAKKQRRKAEVMLKRFHVFGWGIPLIIVGTALGLNKLGKNKGALTSGWCWIDSSLERDDLLLWLWLIGISWDVAAYILVSLFFVMLKCHIRDQISHNKSQFPSQKAQNITLKADRMLALVPFTFILLRVWRTLRWIIVLYMDTGKSQAWWNTALFYLQGFGDSSQGFANFLLFCVSTEQFKTRLRGVAQKLFVCCLLPIKRKLQDSSRYSGEETPMIETRSLADSCHNNYETYD